jgi:acetylornithine deacetylase/succinyl-diaminopimelate desuccinylase-like protein
VLKKRNIAIAKTIHGLTRMTLSPNILKGGIKFNSIPAKAHLDVDIRTLPGQDSKYVKKHLKKALGKKLTEEATIEFISKEGPISFGNSSPEEGEFADLMAETIQALIPKAKVHLLLFPAVTDLRFLREKGVAAYGFSLYDPAFSMNELTNRAHGTNERVNISTVEYTLKAYYLLAKKCLLKN